ncbi:MAG: methionyl-tRNA formyltransferase [Candidatus Paracaedimonas acanthamoebae]|uniref:Methionyl-tRNA formyltransferase n=1 Tax=Candidatus Paracaedimonas acanthamoebae TaxID=244581 RepID=A0A8J7PMJ0_9PROT|nr:methionyl-tRNA formyltransferase [Candidatus Paracaedimonas acanthamoebae]
MEKQRVIFMGTPDFAVPALQLLLDKGYHVIGIYTQPPRPAGRGYHVQKSPVHSLGDRYNIPVFTPKTLKTNEEQTLFKTLKADIAIVAAYGLILPQAILEAPRLGCLNIHGSLLPRWRGAAPIQRAILAGDHETGITIMQMDAGLDTGTMLSKESIPITPQTTASTLHDQLAPLGASLLLKTLEDLQHDQITPQPQPSEGVTYAHKITKQEGQLDWAQEAKMLERQVRAFTPWPGAWFIWQDEIYKVLAAEVLSLSGKVGQVLDDQLTIACGQQAFRPQLIQKQGKKPCSLKDFLNGHVILRGTQLPLVEN